MRTSWQVTAIPGLLLAASSVYAQPNYPTKPIRLIVSFAPGGQGDILARTLGPKAAETFKQSVLVDNRPGGGGTIAYETLVKASPDGYTMILAASGYATTAALHKLSYDPMNDVTPITLICESGFVVALQPSTPVTSIKELIAYDKANPGKLNYGSSPRVGALQRGDGGDQAGRGAVFPGRRHLLR